MQKQKKVIYYDDELNNDFAGTNIHKCTVDENFKYVRRSLFFRVCTFIVYYFIALPIVWFFMRGILRVRFVNKKAVKPYRNTPYFLYGNHSGWYDAYTPHLISAPRKCSTIVSADTVSIKGLRSLVQMLGAIPVPTGFRGMRRFAEAIDCVHKSCNIAIYPEAHIWPYYTGVRPFSDTSFSYAVKNKCPVFAFFTAYSAPKGFLSCFRKANITVYVSDPIFPEEHLSEREARQDLRDKVYRFMTEMSKNSDYKVIEYIQEKVNEPAEKEE